MPLRIIDADTRKPLGGATMTWSSGGAQVEGAASVTGDALLDGVSTEAGLLTVRATNYRDEPLRLTSPPDVLHEVALERVDDVELRCRVVTDSGTPLRGAVIELAPGDRLEATQLATTDPLGIVRFAQLPSGPVRLVARADRYVAMIADSVTVTPRLEETTFVLSRGYRILATVESTVGEGRHAVRVLNEKRVSIDEVLDAASDRMIEGSGRLSLGPLPPGTYIVELHDPSTQRTERVHIDDRDVKITFR